MPRQQLRTLGADVPDAEREEQRRERLLLGRRDAADELLCRLLGKAFERHQLQRRQLVQVGDVGDELRIEQRAHALVAKPANVHRAAAGEVDDAFEDPRRARDVGTVGHHFFVRMLDLRVTARTALRHAKLLLAPGPAGRRPQDLRNHFSRPCHFDPVPDANILRGDQVGVVQRGVGNRDAADLDRLEHGVGIERPRATDVDADLEQLRHLDFGCELASDRPARLAIPDRAQLGVERPLVDFHSDAVSAVIELRQQLLQLRDAEVRGREVGGTGMVRLDGQSPFRHRLQQLVLRLEAEFLTGGFDLECEDAQAARPRNARIELP